MCLPLIIGHDGSQIGHPDWGMSVWMSPAGSTLTAIRDKVPQLCGRGQSAGAGAGVGAGEGNHHFGFSQ